MTIPNYSIFSRSARPPELPPLADDQSKTAGFAYEYTGNAEIERRIWGALARFAATRWGFWQSPVLAVAISVAALVFAFDRYPASTLVAIVLVLLAGLARPLRVLWGARRAARAYSLPGEVYGSSFDEFALLWKVPGVLYSIRFAQIGRVFTSNQVFVLALQDSDAVCVLPKELVTVEVIEKLTLITAKSKPPDLA